MGNKKNRKQIFISIIIFLLFNSTLVTYLTYYLYHDLLVKDLIPNWQRTLACYVFFFFIILNLYVLKTLLSFFKLTKDTELYKNNIKYLDRLINNMRTQRHEFNNHLQIIWGFLSLGKTQNAIEYIETISNNLSGYSKFYGLGCIELSAMLYAKYSISQKLNIEFSINCNVDFAEHKFDSIDLINMCGNLIDNAFYYAKNSYSKFVDFKIEYSEPYILISTTNSGSYINSYEKDKIFELGYSTKNSSGIGLFIVKSIIEKYSGFINVKSFIQTSNFVKEPWTTFEIYLPKKKLT